MEPFIKLGPYQLRILLKKDNNQPGPCLEKIHLPEKEIYIYIYIYIYYSDKYIYIYICIYMYLSE
jgi:hypothetical protein